MYCFESKVRYSETDSNGHLSIGAMIDYFQDCSNFHSDSINQGFEQLAKRHRSWFLCSWNIIINRLPKSGESIKVYTWPTAFKGFCGNRNYKMCDEAGEELVIAETIWAFMDTESYHPVKITMEDTIGYELEPKLDMPMTVRKIKIEDKGVTKEAFRIKRMNLDTNMHVNNGQYIQMAEEYIPQDMKIRSIRTEYKLSAKNGDIIIPKVHIKDNIYTVTLNNTEDNIFATVQFVE